MTTFTVSELFAPTDYIDRLAISNAERSIHDFVSGSVCVDHFASVDCLFIRLNGGGHIELLFDGHYTFQQIDSGGYLGHTLQVDQSSLWTLKLLIVRQTNQYHQNIAEHPAPFNVDFSLLLSQKIMLMLQLL